MCEEVYCLGSCGDMTETKSTIHEQDYNLYSSCKKILQKMKANHPSRKKLEHWLKKYDDACTLNRGPNFARSFYWNCVAIDAHKELTKLEVEIFTGPEKELENK